MSEHKEKRKIPSSPEEIVVPSVIFLAEQDGNTERELKAQWLELFKRNINLHSAFLVRVRYSNSQDISVALCLSAAQEDPELLRNVGSVFYKMFGAHEHLDMMFLTPEQQLQIVRVAKPFYTQRPLDA
jgi:hypothetical protein